MGLINCVTVFVPNKLKIYELQKYCVNSVKLSFSGVFLPHLT